ncbi:MAG TPA: PIG-L deacetylase family protein [Flavitalea sp.]|nr:PIG-L deacetylase family protein [Flavitalea sp.]
MKNDASDRRNFIKLSTLSLAGFSLPAANASAKEAAGRKAADGNTDQKLNILCVGGHPGDPEFGCGGTLAKYSAAGHSVTILYLTRGEGWAGDKSLSHEQAAALRTKEAETSCKILQANPLFAGQIDGNSEFSKKRSDEMTKLILSVNPHIVFTQWPIDTHMDHQVTACLTLTAWVNSEQRFDLYYYEVDTGSDTYGFAPTDYVDITDVREKKKAALLAHKTQGPQEIYDKDFLAMENFRGLEAGVKAAEAFVHFKTKAQRATITGL